jgi:hypothetical protein
MQGPDHELQAQATAHELPGTLLAGARSRRMKRRRRRRRRRQGRKKGSCCS